MKRIIRLVFSVTILTTIGCKREVHAPPKPEAVRKSAYSPLGPTVLAAAQLDNSLEECARLARCQRIEELAKDVTQACTGEDGEAGVDALVAEVSNVLDAYECRVQNRAMHEKTALVAPFVRNVECYWSRRWFEPKDKPPANLLSEIELYYRLSTKTVDLLRKKVGNSQVTSSLEIGFCATLKWLSNNFEYARWFGAEATVAVSDSLDAVQVPHGNGYLVAKTASVTGLPRFHSNRWMLVEIGGEVYLQYASGTTLTFR